MKRSYVSIQLDILELVNELEQSVCKPDKVDGLGMNNHLRNVWWFRDKLNEYFAALEEKHAELV